MVLELTPKVKFSGFTERVSVWGEGLRPTDVHSGHVYLHLTAVQVYTDGKQICARSETNLPRVETALVSAMVDRQDPG